MAILLGTQSNGETLPVQVNEFGQLVAKGIDGTPGQPGEQGPSGEQGQPGQNGQPGTPGQGVPLPYGEDGSVLTIQNSVPAWLLPGPVPSPIPSEGLWTNQEDSVQPLDAQGDEIFPPDYLAYGQGHANWLNPDGKVTPGLVVYASELNYNGSPIQLQLENVFNKIITLYWNKQQYVDVAGDIDGEMQTTFSEPNIVLVNESKSSSSYFPAGNDYAGWCIQSYMFNREIASVDISTTTQFLGGNNKKIYFCGWEVEDSGTYAVKRQMKVEEELIRMKLELRSRINQLSQSRD